MSYFNSLKTLKEKIFAKSIISFTGNVDDFVISNYVKTSLKELNDLPDDTYFSFAEYMIYLLSKNGYQSIKYYTPSSNIITVDGNEFIRERKLNLNGMPSENDAPLFMDQFVNEIITEISNVHKQGLNFVKKAYIIDFMDIMNNQNSTTEFQYSSIAKLVSIFNNIYNLNRKTYIDRDIKIIIIARNQEAINNFFTNKNIELKNATILKPDFNEREKFIKDYSSWFNTNFSLDSTNKKQINEAVALTSNLNFRELFQLMKLSSNIDDISDFKSLYNIYMFDKKESEWEKINKDKIKSIVNDLGQRVKGQEYAIEQVKKTIIRSHVGLSGVAQSINSKKPKGILFFAGPTGVGKTELAKSLTEFVFGDETKFIRFDMSEYNHEHSDQKLIGSPPGYVGYESGGQLTNAVKENPFSILLFDEIEKAHDKILDKFLQILEDGRLTSSKGELIDFSETFIIFTSNIGSDSAYNNVNATEKEIRKIYLDAVKDYFYKTLKRPEIYNRIGEKNIVPFNFITDEKVIKEIIEYKYKKLCEKINKEKTISISYNDENSFNNLVKVINSEYDKQLGGRGLVVVFETLFVDELSEFIFENVDLSSSKDKITYIGWTFDVNENKVKFNLN